MIKEQPYSEKFTLLEPWVDQVFTAIKKEIRGEFLRAYPQFLARNFNKKPYDKLTNEELKCAFFKEVIEGNEEIGEWAASRWMFRNAEVYQFFAHTLSKVNPEFEEIEEIPSDIALPLMRSACGKYGAATVYIFSILNAVAFPKEIYEVLREEALKSAESKDEAPPALTVEEVEAHYEKMLAKLSEKYENRFAGMQKKYLADLKGFKKQIADLQRRLQNAG